MLEDSLGEAIDGSGAALMYKYASSLDMWRLYFESRNDALISDPSLESRLSSPISVSFDTSDERYRDVVGGALETLTRHYTASYDRKRVVRLLRQLAR